MHIIFWVNKFICFWQFRFKKLRQDARDVQLILSLSDELEFKDLEELRETLKDAWTGVQTKVEMNAARLEGD